MLLHSSRTFIPRLLLGALTIGIVTRFGLKMILVMTILTLSVCTVDDLWTIFCDFAKK